MMLWMLLLVMLVVMVLLMTTATCRANDLNELLDHILDVHSLPLPMWMCLEWQ